jgi:hypothetical protein
MILSINSTTHFDLFILTLKPAIRKQEKQVTNVQEIFFELMLCAEYFFCVFYIFFIDPGSRDVACHVSAGRRVAPNGGSSRPDRVWNGYFGLHQRPIAIPAMIPAAIPPAVQRIVNCTVKGVVRNACR